MSEAPRPCRQTETTAAYAIDALSPGEARRAQAHIDGCPECRRELAGHRAVREKFACWPADVVRPAADLGARLAARIAADDRGPRATGPRAEWSEPAWDQVAAGIECKLLAVAPAQSRVSMLVRLAPGAGYPAHMHAGVEELYLLSGELWIDERKLKPGGYNYAAPGTSDFRVWSETGCTCLLVTSTQDILT
ncbi:MAG: cupin domain-containing protein [Rhodospirillaceae bacterium]